MTREEIEKRITELENEIIILRQSVEKDVTPTPPHPKPELKLGDMYYYIATDGAVLLKSWYGARHDNECRAIGNVFCTGDAARYAAEYFKVLGEMHDWAGQWDDPWKLSCDGYRVDAVRDLLNDISYGELRFASERDAENCIKAVGEDRLIKYYFGVRDHEADAKTE